jgi:hypothetical protein
MSGMGEPRINGGPAAEHYGRQVDDVVTAEMRSLRQRIGGFRDPLPVAESPARTVCDDCGQEHTTYAAYLAAHRGEDEPPEGRYCLGCVARMVDQSRLTSPPALPGTCEEFEK